MRIRPVRPHVLEPRYKKPLQMPPNPEGIIEVIVPAEELSKADWSIWEALPNVKKLTLKEINAPHPIPAPILAWTKLREIRLEGSAYDQYWTQLPLLPHLQVLSLRWPEIHNWLSVLQECQHLKELNLLRGEIMEGFEGWQLLKACPQLQSLQLSLMEPSLEDLKGLEQLPLQFLFLSKELAPDFYQQQPQYGQRVLYYSQKGSEVYYKYKQVMNYCRLHQMDNQQAAVLLNLLANNFEKARQLSTPEQLLALTDLPASKEIWVEQCRRLALDSYTQNQAPTTAIQQVAVLGQIATPQARLHEQLGKLSIGWSTEILPSTTHVVLGLGSKGAYQQALARQLPLLSEQQLWAYLYQKGEYYLLKDPALMEQVKALLISNQEENWALALQLLQEGGLDRTLMTALFFAWIQAKDGRPVREQLKTFLLQHGSAPLANHISSSYGDYRVPTYFSRSIQDPFQELENTEINVPLLLEYLETTTPDSPSIEPMGKILPFSNVLKLFPTSKAKALVVSKIKNGVLDLKKQSFKQLPFYLFILQEIEVLHLEDNQLQSIPIESLKQLSHLRALHIGGNPRLLQNKQWQQQMAQQLSAVEVFL